MSRYRSISRPSPRAARIAMAVIALGVTAAVLVACTTGEGSTASDVESDDFDPLQMTWSPRSLADAAPCLVGWRNEAAGGELVVLSPDGPEDPAIWRTPADAGSTYVEIVAVDPHGEQMVGQVYVEKWGEEPYQQTVLFGADGTVREIGRPEGFEGISGVAFCDAGLLGVAYQATLDDFQTRLGRIGPGGAWTDLVLTGDVPEHQFVESISARPGSDLVGLVLKIPGGTGDRDDDLLVLARLEGDTLSVVTPPFYDDSLPGARPLLDADGVIFARLWSAAGTAPSPTLMRAEWTGTGWSEREILPAGVVGAGPETGQAVEQEPSGAFWIRDAAGSTHTEGSRLLRLTSDGSEPEAVGVDVSGVSWFAWVDGAR